jgi:AraC-like DNA-binding protein
MLDRAEVGRSIDVLGEILETVRLRSVDVQLAECTAAMTLHQVDEHATVLLLVVRGQLSVDLGLSRMELRAGDGLALLRAAQPLRPESEVEWDFDGTLASRAVDVAEPGLVLRCHCRFAHSDRHPLLSALPRVIHVPSQQWGDLSWLQPTLAWIGREVDGHGDGSKAVTNRLVELLWIQLIRSHLASTGAATHGWLRALSDAQIGEALGLIHDQPAMRFTVAGLAHAVGMSRSAFACQFTRLVGEPPLHYIAQWRMLRAAQLLKEDKHTLAEIALAVGYESEAAFSKAFKRWSGQAPGSYRRDSRSEPGSTEALAC